MGQSKYKQHKKIKLILFAVALLVSVFRTEAS